MQDNLQESVHKITAEFTHKVADMEDAAVYAYLKGAIELLQGSGEDITKFALVRVDNPMELVGSSLAIKSQYRIVPISELANIPVYED